MAKALRHTPPTSSVARLLDVDAGSRALAPANSKPPDSELSRPSPISLAGSQPLQAIAPSGEPANLKRELVLSSSTDEAFTRLVDLYRKSTGTRLSNSHVARAIFKGMAHCMESLEREAREVGKLKLPSNARGREGERERFEDRIAQAIIAGIRSAPAMPRD